MRERSSNIPLREALAQIGEIRTQIVAATVFRGYRALTVAGTGVLAVFASMIQAVWLPAPESQLASYLTLWIGVAVSSIGLVAAELVRRYAASESALVRQGILQAVEQFMPCVLAGAMLTMSLVRFAPASTALLPGLWAMFFSLGIFSSCRRLPQGCFLIGAFYMAAGIVSIACARDAHALSPYAMGVTFGVGQLATAAVLYFALERKDAPTE
jgi:hypothetical protein